MTHCTLLLTIFVLAIFFPGCERQKESNTGKNNLSTNIEATNRTEAISFRTLDKRELLLRLFDNPKIDSLEMAVWKPNYYDLTSLPIPLSYDNQFHTSLDTIMFFKDTKNTECGVAIFSTYNFQMHEYDKKVEPTGCHFCGVPIGVALFYKTKYNKWELYKFQKEIDEIGYFGTYKSTGLIPAKIELKEIGDKWTCLSLSYGLGGNGGYLEGGESLFSIERYYINGLENSALTEILSFYYGFSETYLENNKVPSYTTIVKPKSHYNLSTLEVDDKQIKTRHYKFSTDIGKYIEE
ncbi:MAG: hypothetical protein ABI723_05120 [Bacteroidia bacterium]